MKVHAADDLIEYPRKRRTSVGVGRSSGSGSGSGDPGDNGGDIHFPLSEPETAPEIDKSKFIAWFLLMAVGMTFAGLMGAYLMLATNKVAEWQPFDLPVQIWVSTAIILASSFTFSWAKRCIDRTEEAAARKWLLVTTVLGGLFISSQLVLWIELVQRGFYLSGNPYAGFFYILTAAHLVHVAGGIVALGAIQLRAWYPSASETETVRRQNLARSVGWYWHFMGGLWVALFLLLGLWK